MVVKQESSHRQRQAQATREAVARAARALFREHGYATTTIASIGEAADIPTQTIYSAFGNKTKILDEILRMWMAESDTVVLHEQGLANPDPAQRLRTMAALNRYQLERGYDVIAIYQQAARADPRMADVLREVLGRREGAIRGVIVSLEGSLAAGLTVAAGLDRYLAVSQPEIYQLLVIERGWSPEEYEIWLGDLLVSQLLGTPSEITQ